MKLISPKTFKNMTEKTSSAINTIFNGLKSLAQVRVKGEVIAPVPPPPPNPKTWKESIKDSLKCGYNYCKDSQVSEIISENKGLIVACVLVAVVVWYNRDAAYPNFEAPISEAPNFQECVESKPEYCDTSEALNFQECVKSKPEYCTVVDE
jgi:hypothetical protein